MLIVSDASPLHYLVLIEHVDVLSHLFNQIVAPPIVLEELRHPRAPQSVREWAASPPSWLVLRKPVSFDAGLSLDPGEQEAIALALELHADGLLIDERRGRIVARQLNLATYGTLAVLQMAASKHLIDLHSAVEKLNHTSFRIDASILKKLLRFEA